MPASTVPTVPIASNGLEGWTSCCAAAVTYSETALCCKACWNEVDTVRLEGDDGVALGVIVEAVIMGAISADEGVKRQQALLAEVVA